MLRRFRGPKTRHDEEVQKALLEDETTELTMLRSINAIVTLAEDSHLDKEFFMKAERFINYLAERQGLTSMQAVLLSLFIEASASGNNAEFSDIADFLDCNNVQVFQYKGEVDEMVKGGLLRLVKNKMTGDSSYSIPQSLLDAMASNKAFVQELI